MDKPSGPSSNLVVVRARKVVGTKKIGHAGLYATFRSYYDEDKEDTIDKRYWGEVDDEMMVEEDED